MGQVTRVVVPTCISHFLAVVVGMMMMLLLLLVVVEEEVPVIVAVVVEPVELDVPLLLLPNFVVVSVTRK